MSSAICEVLMLLFNAVSLHIRVSILYFISQRHKPHRNQFTEHTCQVCNPRLKTTKNKTTVKPHYNVHQIDILLINAFCQNPRHDHMLNISK